MRRRRYRGPFMARILVAASAEASAIVERILAGHELYCVATMAEAEQFLREQTVDLIVCTIFFDESKMFELLRLAKLRPEWQRIPFVAARVRPKILLSSTAMRSTAFTCGTLGAKAFLDL